MELTGDQFALKLPKNHTKINIKRTLALGGLVSQMTISPEIGMIMTRKLTSMAYELVPLSASGNKNDGLIPLTLMDGFNGIVTSIMVNVAPMMLDK